MGHFEHCPLRRCANRTGSLLAAVPFIYMYIYILIYYLFLINSVSVLFKICLAPVALGLGTDTDVEPDVEPATHIIRFVQGQRGPNKAMILRL